MKTAGVSRIDQRWSARSAILAWALWCAIYLGGALLFVGITRAYPGDEQRFIETSRLFAAGLTVDLLQHYPEMSGPLPFAIFSMWGHHLGWGLSSMRVLAVAIGFCTLMLMYVWLCDALGSHTAAFLSGLALCLNPYVAAMSVFLYTDMISMLFVMLALVAVERKNNVVLALALAAALLSRQYLVFVPLAIGFYALLKRNRGMLAAVLVSVLPLAWLVWLWGGLAPASPMRPQYLNGGAGFHIAAFAGYTGLLAIYLAPFLMIGWRRSVPGWRGGVAILGISAIAWAFPVRPSPFSIRVGVSTVGLLDRGLTMLLPSVAMRDGFYWIAFLLGLAVVAVFIREASKRRLPSMMVVSFLLVMPFSYLYWEK